MEEFGASGRAAAPAPRNPDGNTTEKLCNQRWRVGRGRSVEMADRLGAGLSSPWADMGA
jgi:hypothetical protein